MPESVFISALDAQCQALYLPVLANNALYVGSNIQNLQGGPPYELPWGTNANQANGTGGATPLPAQVTGIYGTTSEFTGPAYRGRSYVPFPTSEFVTAGPPPIPSNAYLTLLGLLALQFTGLLPIASGGVTVTVQWILVQFSVGGAVFSYTPLTGFKLPQRWATQKRRGDYGRTNPMPTP